MRATKESTGRPAVNDRVWPLRELVRVTGGKVVGTIDDDAVLGGAVYPLGMVRLQSILIHCREGDWPLRQRRLSGQIDLSLSDILNVASKKGAALVITSDDTVLDPPVPVLVVQDCYQALFDLAEHARKRTRGRVISVTGTTGKSSTKELVFSLLSQLGTCSRLNGNWNSVEGSAMCLACLPEDTDFCIVEQSEESIQGQRGRSSINVLRPDDLIITKLGIGKLSRFPSVEDLATEIARQVGTLPEGGRLYVPDELACREVIEEAADGVNVRRTGPFTTEPIRIELLTETTEGLLIRISNSDHTLDVRCQLIGETWIENIRQAALCAHDNGATIDQIAQVLEKLKPTPRKMEPVLAQIADKTVFIIDDSHNAELQSFVAALKSFRKVTQSYNRRIVIAGKIVEIAGAERQIYTEIAKVILDCDPFAVILFGDELDWLMKALGPVDRVVSASTVDEVVSLLDLFSDDRTAVLVKGSSRNTGMKELSGRLRIKAQGQNVVRPRSLSAGQNLGEGKSVRSEKIWPIHHQEATSSPRFSIAFLGDTSLGDVYLSKPRWSDVACRLEENPWSFFEQVSHLFDDTSIKLMNLETVLCENPLDPFDGKKGYQGWDRPDRTLGLLKRLSITAVSLANNHSIDFGLDPFLQTIEELDHSGISVIGAGPNIHVAVQPLQLVLPKGSAYVFAGFEYRSRYEQYGFYATEKGAGVAPLLHDSGNDIAAQIRLTRAHDPEALIIVFPHWSGANNYRWVTREMREMNRALLHAGADLIVGHGAHMMQEIVTERSGTTAFSLGNLIFNSPGRYAANNAPPYSFVGRLDLDTSADMPVADLRFYPFLSDNRRTGFRARPVTESEMIELVVALGSRPLSAGLQDYVRIGLDSRGYHLQFLGNISPRIKGIARRDNRR